LRKKPAEKNGIVNIKSAFVKWSGIMGLNKHQPAMPVNVYS
jgi:hypothetical protein